jgi:hypothetical protein
MREGGRGEWRKQHNQKLHNLCSSANILAIKEYETGKTYGIHGGFGGGKPKGRGTFGRSKSKWHDKYKETAWKG